jgi:hypothetical protein
MKIVIGSKVTKRDRQTDEHDDTVKPNLSLNKEK